MAYEIRRDGNLLLGQETGRKLDTLKVEAPDVLFVPGQPRYRKVFRREAWDLAWERAR